MFYLNRETELTTELLYKMVNKFRLDVEPKLRKYKNYYDGLQAIINKKYVDESKPCNKIVTNYCKNITDSYCGYLATPSYISYSSREDITDVMDILKYNDYQAEDADFLLDALVYGTAAELMYLDNASRVRFKLINPTSCFGVYDDSLSSDLMYFVRMYKASEWEDTDTYNLDVYSDYSVKHYKMSGQMGALTFVSEEQHFFSQCPANIFTLADEKSIFDCIMGLQDAHNELVSSEVDDFAAFCDAYMILKGVDADAEDIAQMRANRAASIPSDAEMYYLTKNISDTQVENILKRIHSDIYRIASCPDFSSESFVGGVSSGVAIQYRLTGMETRAGMIEATMKKALQRRVEIIAGIASLKLGEEVFRDINIEFKRNIPTDYTEVINLVNSLKGTISDKTLLSLLPFVDDVEEELEALQEQKQANMALYAFGTSNPVEDDEEEDTEEVA